MAVGNADPSIINGPINSAQITRSSNIQLTGLYKAIVCYLIFGCLVVSAKLNGGGIFNFKAPDVYIEIVVDSNADQEKRTTLKKKTNSPHWDETFQLSVSENSIIEFRVLGKAKVFEDALLASKSVKISHWLRKESDNGKCLN